MKPHSHKLVGMEIELGFNWEIRYIVRIVVLMAGDLFDSRSGLEPIRLNVYQG